jgi:hypothetical protein
MSPITFYANVVGEFLVQEFVGGDSPVAAVEVKPGQIVGQSGLGPLFSLGGPGVPRMQRVAREVSLSIVGKAEARFEENKFVGDVAIRSVEVRKD